MQIFITGGAGFIGSNVANYYLKQGVRTIIYDNLTRKGSEKNLSWIKKNHSKLLFHKSDIRNYSELTKSMKGSTIIYHMASQVAVTSSVQNPREDFEVNALGTLNVLEAARQMNKPPIILFASTNKVYGELNNIKLTERKERYDFKDYKYQQGIDEDFQLDFHSPYGCSKGTGDQYVRDYSRIYGLKTIVFRQSCIYGGRQFGNEDQGWVAHFAIQALQNKPIIIYGDGKQVRDLLLVDDLIECYNSAIKNINKTSGNIYNVGGGYKNSVSLIETINIIEKKIQSKVNIKFSKWRTGDQKIYISNNNKAKNDFSWKPTTSVYEGIDTLLLWLKTI